MATDSDTYPGTLATPAQIRELADAYCSAAHLLLGAGERRKPLTRAPFRLSAIHAIELYLNAFLLTHGRTATEVRGLRHDLRARTELAIAAGLRLRVKTIEHLKNLHESREYLVMRYGPELAATASQINRLTATLEEVAHKVTASIAARDDRTS